MVAKTKQEEVETIQYKFSGGYEGRDAGTEKDQRFVNMYVETINEKRKVLVKRPGISEHLVVAAGEVRGMFFWNGSLWSVIDDVLYQDDTDSGTALDTDTGIIGYTECTLSGVPVMFFCDGTKGYLIDDTDTVTEITDVDFPSPHVPTPVFIDGYVCLPAADSADIYNCDLDDPTEWTTSNYITSEIYPDPVVALARQNNQVVALGETGTEFFYNNGDEQPTGTPLARNPQTFLQFGTCAPYAIGQNERYCFFISQSQSGGRAVQKLDGFTPEKVSTSFIERILDNEDDAIVNATGFLIRVAGHFFFIIHLSERTLVYDIEEKEWSEWTSSHLNTPTPSALGNWLVNGLQVNGNSSWDTTIITENFKWIFASDLGDGKVYLISNDTGVIGKLDPSVYTDLENSIRCEVNTPLLDFGSLKRKTFIRLTLIGDLAENSIYIRWTDDDYRTWSNVKILSMSNRPVLHKLGSSRKRAFSIYYTDNYPLRLEGIDLLYYENLT